MKKFLLISICLLIALAGFSQNTSGTDTLVRLPVSQVRNAIRAQDSLNIMKGELGTWKQLVSLYQQLAVKDSVIIVRADDLDKANKRLLVNSADQMTNLQKQQQTITAWNTALQGVIKKKNWMIVKVAGVSVAVIGGLTYLLLK